MFGRLFRKVRVVHQDDDLLIVRYKARGCDFYIGAFDTDVNFTETKTTLEAMGRIITAQPLFRNDFLTVHERLGHSLMGMGYEVDRAVGQNRCWFFDRAPSALFVTTAPPLRCARQLRRIRQQVKSKKIIA